MAHLLISRFSTAPVSQQEKLGEHTSSIRRSLVFSGLRDNPTGGVDPGDEASVQALG